MCCLNVQYKFSCTLKILFVHAYVPTWDEVIFNTEYIQTVGRFYLFTKTKKADAPNAISLLFHLKLLVYVYDWGLLRTLHVCILEYTYSFHLRTFCLRAIWEKSIISTCGMSSHFDAPVLIIFTFKISRFENVHWFVLNVTPNYGFFSFQMTLFLRLMSPWYKQRE